MAEATQRIAVVSGSNKGIGLEIVKQLASAGVKVNNAAVGGVIFGDNSLTTLAITNGGVLSNEWAKGVLSNVEKLTEERINEVVKEFLKDFKEGSHERKKWPKMLAAYRVSKAAMNAYTRILAIKYPKICINSVCPGYVKTDITANTGILTAEEGASKIVRLALLPNGVHAAGDSIPQLGASAPAMWEEQLRAWLQGRTLLRIHLLTGSGRWWHPRLHPCLGCRPASSTGSFLASSSEPQLESPSWWAWPTLCLPFSLPLAPHHRLLALLMKLDLNRIAIVSGSNKGIGLKTVKQLASAGVKVVLTARDEKKGLEALESLRNLKFSELVVFHQPNVIDASSVSSLAHFIKSQFGKLDILVNNAGVCGVTYGDDNSLVAEALTNGGALSEDERKRAMSEPYELGEECLEINYYGAKRTIEAFLPLLQLSHSPTIVNVSSFAGTLQVLSNEWAKGVLSDVEKLTEERINEVVKEFLKDLKEGSHDRKGWPEILAAYKVSKAAMNAYTRILAKRYPKICINCVCPGFVKTDINANTGFFTVEEVVSGSNKGIGLEIVKQLASVGVKVVLTARDEKKGLEALQSLRELGFSDEFVIFHQLDVADAASVTSFAHFIKSQFGKLDILVNNAGVCGVTYGDNSLVALALTNGGVLSNEWAKGVLSDVEKLTEERINEVVKEFLKDLKEGLHERKGWPKILAAYKVSKAAMNAYTRILAMKYPKICINCLCPGFVKTDINANTGILTTEEGASNVVKLALLPNGSPSGLFYNQKEVFQF
ncbi:carbonyl reductase [Senna tora]|uniref:Carbonyl reductase n=1 Tax=Senna tora TaxID=362788 RepID=A0A834W517_9FABA|nr:carbonyl reductase [Senna tora]